MQQIEDFPLEELLSDKEETLADIIICKRALANGIETYFNGTENVRYRLAQNERILKVINAELRRRELND